MMKNALIMPKRPPRAIVSVAFERAEFKKVEEAAKAAGVPISRYIREKVLAAPTCTLHGGTTTEGVEAHFYEVPLPKGFADDMRRTWGTI